MLATLQLHFFHFFRERLRLATYQSVHLGFKRIQRCRERLAHSFNHTDDFGFSFVTSTFFFAKRVLAFMAAFAQLQQVGIKEELYAHHVGACRILCLDIPAHTFHLLRSEGSH